MVTAINQSTNVLVEQMIAWLDNKPIPKAQLPITKKSQPIAAATKHTPDKNASIAPVKQKNADLPFLNCVNIDSAGYVANNSFSQYYNHYHCANIPLYSEYYSEMSTVFFGGIAQYYDNAGILTQDNNVPFVNTIARITRDNNGVMAEYKLPITMPSLLGAGSEFIPLQSIARYHNGVIKLDSLSNDTTVIGYMFGGIRSSAAKIFCTNTGTQSSASNQLFEVKIIKGNFYSLPKLNIESTGTLKLQVFPNPNRGDFKVKFFLTKNTNVQLKLTDINGKIIEMDSFKNLIVSLSSLSCVEYARITLLLSFF